MQKQWSNDNNFAANDPEQMNQQRNPCQIIDIEDILKEALSFHRKGFITRAKSTYEEIIKINPNHANALFLLGVIYAQKNNHQQSVGLISKAIARQPDNAYFHFVLGNSLKELGRFDESISSYDQAIALKSDYAEAYLHRGAALHEVNQFEREIWNYDQAIALNLPNLSDTDRRTEAYFKRGSAMKELKRWQEALVSYDQAINLNPHHAEALCNRGNILNELKQLEEAVASYNKTIELEPSYAEPYYNRGVALAGLNQMDEAIASYDQAIALKPDYMGAHYNKSLALLVKGELAAGWELYEWRWRNENDGPKQRDFGQPLWLGKEPLQGKTILLHNDQGLGDAIHFCRYARLVAALGGIVVLEVQQPLTSLLRHLQGVDTVIARGHALPDFDCHCPLLSLPLAFGTTLDNIPNEQRYLSSDPEKIRLWEKRLGRKAAKRIGLVWSGNEQHSNDHNRSVTLAQLLPYLPSSFHYVSLQKELRAVDREALNQQSMVEHYGDELHDFSDTAALCELMDLVVSVDTSVAHLSAALGKPTWILLPFKPDWRWLLDRPESVWYPTARLYRQNKRGEWGNVFESIRDDLLQWHEQTA